MVYLSGHGTGFASAANDSYQCVSGVAGPRLRYFFEAIALLVIGVFALIAAIKGYDMMMDSIALGRRQPTMLALPNWIAELPIVVGFVLLFLQSLIDLIRLPFGPPPSFSAGGEHDLDVADEPAQKVTP